MPKPPVDIALSLFTGGFNEVTDPAGLAPNEAQVARDVDYRSGALRGLRGPGDSGYTDTVPAGTTTLFFDATSGVWRAYGNGRYALDTGDGIIVTQVDAGPVLVEGESGTTLGVPEIPNIASTSLVSKVPGDTGKIANWFLYALTFVTADGLESNPRFVDVYAGDLNPSEWKAVRIAYDMPTDPRYTKVRVYRSNATNYVDPDTGVTTGIAYGVPKDPLTGAAYGTLYFMVESAIDGDIYDSGNPNGTFPLTHGPGGFTGSEGITDDHSAPPTLVMLSDGVHSTTQANGASGMIVGVDTLGNVRYSRFGHVHYWPVINSFKPPGEVQALITHTASTMIFTDRAIYAMTGTTDETVSFSLTNSNVGCLPGAGRAVVYTPYGVLFPSVRGIELFDGDRSQVLTANKLNPDTLQGWTIRGAAFWDNQYLLFHDDGTLIVDLRTLPDVVLTTSDLKASAVQVANAVLPPAPPPPPPVTCDPDAPPLSGITSLAAPESPAVWPVEGFTGATIAATATKVVAVGQSNGVGSWLPNVAVYDIASGVWSAGSDCPAPISGNQPVAVTADDDTILLWGYNSTTHLNYLYKYVVSTNTWTALSAGSSTEARYDANVAFGDNKLYVFGGVIPPTGPLAIESNGHPTVRVYDYTGGTWSDGIAPSDGIGRMGCATVYHSGKLIMSSGRYAIGAGAAFETNKIVTYDITTGTLAEVGIAPISGQGVYGAATTGEGMYVGFDTGSSPKYVYRTSLSDYSSAVVLTAVSVGATPAVARGGDCAIYVAHSNGFGRMTS